MVMPSLQRLMAIGKFGWHQETSDTLLCRSFGISPQQDWPIAAFSWLGEGGQPGNAYWLCADPVHLILQRDHFTLSEPVPLAVARPDADVLVASLNQHFAAGGLQFHIGSSGRWYLQPETPPAIATSLPEAAIGRDTSAYMPQGMEAAQWNRLLNEMQMLLFEHPINQAREMRGELPINSIWLSGGGILPTEQTSNNKTVYADIPLAKGLAQAANLPCLPVPDNLAAILDKPQRDAVLVLDNAEDAELKWFSPLLQALRSRQISHLRIYLALHGEVLQLEAKPTDTWKFWCRVKPLETYLNGGRIHG
jgi:hypothetical protein